MAIDLQDVRVKSAVARAGWDSDTHTLRVVFRSGAIYDYENVPASVYAELLRCSNPMAYLAKTVRADPQRNPFRRVDLVAA